MNGFIKKSIGTLTLGEKLRKIRSDKRISLNEVSRSTKIKLEYLQYLEDGNFEKLPADVYVKGFLRSYADFLGVDGDVIVRLYEKEAGIKRNIRKKEDKDPEPKALKPLSVSAYVFTPKKAIIFSFIVLIVAGFIYIYREIGSFSSNPRLIILNPEPNSQIDGDSVVVDGMTEKDVKLFINDQPILVNEEGNFRETLTLKPGNNVLNLKSVNKFGKETQQSVTVQANYEEPQAPPQEQQGQDQGKPEILEGIELEISVEPGPVWLSVESDGNLVFSGTMLSGASQKFHANEKITVNSGKANATHIKFNGKDVGTLGKDPGAARGVIFTKDTKFQDG